MAVAPSRRPIITLYSDKDCMYSHRVRIVIAEKNVTVHREEVNTDEMPEELMELNPYNTSPTLVDRKLVLYNSLVIMEYLDERYPHPPLMAVDPVSKANSRLTLRRIDEGFYSEAAKIGEKNDAKTKAARKALLDGLIGLVPTLKQSSYLFGEDFTLVDCAMAPLLWRLPYLGISLPPKAKPLIQYAQRIFDRPSFQDSLTEYESDLRE